MATWQDGGLVPDVTRNASQKAFQKTVVAAVEANQLDKAVESVQVDVHQEVIDGTRFVVKGDNVRLQGKATAGAASTLSDTTKTLVVDAYTNKRLRIVAGTGVGQERIVASNTATIFTIVGTWATIPDATSRYEIVEAVSNVVTRSEPTPKNSNDIIHSVL